MGEQDRSKTPAGSWGRRGLAAVVRLVTLALLLVLVFAALSLILVPRATGSQTYTVLTNSMAHNTDRNLWMSVGAAALICYGAVLIVRTLRGMRRSRGAEKAGQGPA